MRSQSSAAAAFSPAQIAAVFLGVVFIDAGYQASLGQPAAHPVLAWLSILAYGLGFAALALAARNRRFLDETVAAGFVLAFVFLAAVRLITQPVPHEYGTDALAFNHYSAQVLLQGHDPYSTSMEPAFREFNVPATVYTETADGGFVLSQSYPALSFLTFVPFVLLHLRSMLVVDLGLALLSLLLVTLLAGRGNKALAVLVFFASAEYVNFAFGSVTDVSWLPFMIVVAAFWDSPSLIAPIALGLACAAKQDPWFVVPFAVVHWTGMRARVPFARNATAALLAFALPNLPFILWNPAAWLRGILSPLISGAIPNGSGVVQLATSTALPFPVAWLSWLWPAVFLAGIALYAVRYRSLGWLPFVWPAITLFFSPRSLENYFAYWPIVATAYLVSAHRAPAPEAVPVPDAAAVRRAAVAVAALSACVFAVVVWVTAAAFRPLHGMRIGGVRFDPATGLVRSLSIAVSLPPAAVRAYRFAIDSPANGAVFWKMTRVSDADAGRSVVELRAPGIDEEVPVSPASGFQVAAYAKGGRLAGYTPMWVDAADAYPSLSSLHIVCARSRFAPIARAAPLAWTFEPGAFLSGSVACEANGRRDGTVVFRVPRPSGNYWNAAALSQSVNPAGENFSFWLKPGADSSASISPTHLFGVSIVDGLDQQFYVVTNSTLRAPEFLTQDSFRYYVVPAKLGRWNHIRIDAADLRGFYAAPYTPVIVMIMDAIHGGDSESVTDDEFGGFGAHP